MTEITERNHVLLMMPPRSNREIHGEPQFCCVEGERQLRDLASRRISTVVRVVGPDAKHIGLYLTDVIQELSNEDRVRQAVPEGTE